MTSASTRKIAVVLFNLGGPDDLDAVRPFLFNLFRDQAIIRLPAVLRYPLAALIAWRRAPIARDIYRQMGGKSPIVAETQAQANALQRHLSERHSSQIGVFIAMRYWYPRAVSAYQAVAGFNPDDVVLVPLYPHYSTTTTESSLSEWNRLDAKKPLTARRRTICCYPTEADFIAAHTDRLSTTLDEAPSSASRRILFSAHGLPKRIIDAGDPYQRQIEATAAAIMAQLNQDRPTPILDWIVCYQSRVGPLEWIGPSTESEIQRAGSDRIGVIIVPIAFVSEHSETLVELDIEYRQCAEQSGVPSYQRVATASVHPLFIQALAKLVTRALADDAPPILCPGDAPGSPCSDFIPHNP